MSEFNEWWEENYMTLSSDRTEAEDIYNLGKQSQQVKIDRLIEKHSEEKRILHNVIEMNQAKIDELKKKYDAMYNAFIVADDCRKEWHESYMSARKERYELQGRIDGALSHLDLACPESWGCCVEQAIGILKGSKDETII